MKTLMILLALFAATGAGAIPSDNVPHLDKVFLFARDERTGMVAALTDDLKPFCEMAAKASDTQREKIELAALESCRLAEVVNSLKESEAELQIKNGEPYMLRAQSGPFDETAVWHYFIRTQEVHRLMRSLRTYFSQAADTAGRVRVSMIGIPTLAASLDNYSYWSRLIAMKEASSCPDENLPFCRQLEAQLGSLAQTSWLSVRTSDAGLAIGAKTDYLMSIAKTLQTRLSTMTLDELDQLDKMEDVTSAGLGIPFFRQLMTRLNLTNAGLSPVEQENIRRSVMLNEIHDALAEWSLPKTPIEVHHDSVERLSEELNSLVKSGEVL